MRTALAGARDEFPSRIRCTCAPLILLALAHLLGACAAVDRGADAGQEPLLVAAAASLEPAFGELGGAFTAQTGQAVEFVFGSSGNLATQIENGAPFDVFASADEGFVERLAQRGMIVPDTRAVYAQGRLVLVVNVASGLDVDSIDELAESRVPRVAIANPELAPYGLAAQQALQARGVWESVEAKIVQGANVRQALQYVQTGDAPAGLVALSIADVPEVTFTPVDPALHEPLNQALAVVAGTDQEPAARAFTAFVLGPEGQSILAEHGFAMPENP